MDTDDIKLDIPHISTGPDGGKTKKKRDKDGKFKSAGGGLRLEFPIIYIGLLHLIVPFRIRISLVLGSSRKKRPPPPPNNTKKLILGAGVLLCIVSLVAIILGKDWITKLAIFYQLKKRMMIVYQF